MALHYGTIKTMLEHTETIQSKGGRKKWEEQVFQPTR